MGNHFSNIKPLSGLYKEWFLDYALCNIRKSNSNILDGKTCSKENFTFFKRIT